MPKRNRAFLVLVFPIAVILWIIGWVLSNSESHKKENPKTQTKPRKQTDLTFYVPELEQIEEEPEQATK
jgi:hypothetical protein